MAAYPDDHFDGTFLSVRGRDSKKFRGSPDRSTPIFAFFINNELDHLIHSHPTYCFYSMKCKNFFELDINTEEFFFVKNRITNATGPIFDSHIPFPYIIDDSASTCTIKA